MRFLLKNGIILTTMLRHVKKNSVEDLKGMLEAMSYESVIKSVAFPPQKRPVLRLTDNLLSVEQTDYKYDFLSPPLLLNQKENANSLSRDCDAMGFLNGKSGSYNSENFGGAIIELRDIKNVGMHFLSPTHKAKGWEFSKIATASRRRGIASSLVL